MSKIGTKLNSIQKFQVISQYSYPFLIQRQIEEIEQKISRIYQNSSQHSLLHILYIISSHLIADDPSICRLLRERIVSRALNR